MLCSHIGTSGVPGLVAVMGDLHTLDLESYISQRKFDIPGVSDMITTLKGAQNHFSFFLRYNACRVLQECMLAPLFCHVPAVKNALITAYFHCWDACLFETLLFMVSKKLRVLRDWRKRLGMELEKDKMRAGTAPEELLLFPVRNRFWRRRIQDAITRKSTVVN